MLTKDEARKKRERKHSPFAWTCTLCGKECRGSGGRTSHQNWHLKKEGVPRGDWESLVALQVAKGTRRTTPH